jgi:hypothetical protein
VQNPAALLGMTKNNDDIPAVESFFLGALAAKLDLAGRNFSILLGDQKSPIAATFEARLSGNTLVLLENGVEFHTVPDLVHAMQAWKARSAADQADLSSRGEKFLIGRAMKRLAALAPVSQISSNAYVGIDLAELGAQGLDQNELGQAVQFLTEWALQREGVHFVIQDGNNYLSQAQGARLSATGRVLINENVRNFAVVQIHFTNSHRAEVVTRQRNQFIVNVLGFSEGLPNIVAGLLASENLSVIYFRHLENGNIPVAVSDAILKDLDASYALKIINEFSATKARVVTARLLHEVGVQANRKPEDVLLVTMGPILKFLNDRLRAFQLMREVGIFA